MQYVNSIATDIPKVKTEVILGRAMKVKKSAANTQKTNNYFCE